VRWVPGAGWGLSVRPYGLAGGARILPRGRARVPCGAVGSWDGTGRDGAGRGGAFQLAGGARFLPRGRAPGATGLWIYALGRPGRRAACAMGATSCRRPSCGADLRPYGRGRRPVARPDHQPAARLGTLVPNHRRTGHAHGVSIATCRRPNRSSGGRRGLRVAGRAGLSKWRTSAAQPVRPASTPAVDRDLAGVAVPDVVRPPHDHPGLCGLWMLRRWPRAIA
jgi:hypothetical protein